MRPRVKFQAGKIFLRSNQRDHLSLYILPSLNQRCHSYTTTNQGNLKLVKCETTIEMNFNTVIVTQQFYTSLTLGIELHTFSRKLQRFKINIKKLLKEHGFKWAFKSSKGAGEDKAHISVAVWGDRFDSSFGSSCRSHSQADQLPLL